MIIHTVWQKSFDFFGSKPVVVEPSAGQLSSDAGLWVHSPLCGWPEICYWVVSWNWSVFLHFGNVGEV